MSYWIYSSEALPNPEMMGKPGYSPDGEYIRYASQQLPLVPKKQWMKLPDSFKTIRRQDWKDRQGTEIEIHVSRFKGVIDSRFAERGVIFLDHEPSAKEKQELEKVSEELNLKFRAKMIDFFENERAMAVARQGRYPVTPYVDECYDILAFPKPYSVDTLKSQRMPGHEAAERIADAIANALKEAKQEKQAVPAR